LIEVLYFSQKDVRERLLARVDANRSLLLVTGVRHSKGMRPVPEREPFASLESWFGAVLDMVVVADEGTAAGMWRDPLGALADKLFPNNRADAYSAAQGYLLLREGEAAAIIKKRRTPEEDLWHLQDAMASVDGRVPAPNPGRKPITARTSHFEPPPPAPPKKPIFEEDFHSAPPDDPPEDFQEDTPTGPPTSGPRAAPDPWTVLGIPRGTPRAEARKAFRALVSQYHPDKVAHLALEFRELAEQRTRQILDAWQRIQAEETGGDGTD
jgi:DnaJ-domain-containing protein 1